MDNLKQLKVFVQYKDEDRSKAEALIASHCTDETLERCGLILRYLRDWEPESDLHEIPTTIWTTITHQKTGKEMKNLETFFEAATGMTFKRYLNDCLDVIDSPIPHLLPLHEFSNATYEEVMVKLSFGGQVYEKSAKEWFKTWCENRNCGNWDVCPDDETDIPEVHISAVIHPPLDSPDFKCKKFYNVKFYHLMESIRPYVAYVTRVENIDGRNFAYRTLSLLRKDGETEPHYILGPYAARNALQFAAEHLNFTIPCAGICPVCGEPLIPSENGENSDCYSCEKAKFETFIDSL